jgi:hypothetical protein
MQPKVIHPNRTRRRQSGPDECQSGKKPPRHRAGVATHRNRLSRGIGDSRAQWSLRTQRSGDACYLRNVSSCSNELEITSRNSARLPLSFCI